MMEHGPALCVCGPACNLMSYSKTGSCLSGHCDDTFGSSRHFASRMFASMTLLGGRVTGPLFFGFSDPVTQRAIAALYEPHELAAALQARSLCDVSMTKDTEAAQRQLWWSGGLTVHMRALWVKGAVT